MKKTIRYAIIAAAVLVLPLFSTKDVNAATGTVYPALGTFYSVKCDISYKVSSISHLFLNKYDVDMQVDGKKIATIKNGETVSGKISLYPGMYMIEFVRSSDGSLSAAQMFEISENESFSCDLDCEKNKINVTNYKRTAQKGSKAVSYPWKLDAKIAEANDYIYGKVIDYSSTLQAYCDCFTMYVPEDNMYYVFMKSNPGIDGSKSSELCGSELNKILKGTGVDIQFVFVDKDENVVDVYDSYGKTPELASIKSWYSLYGKDYWNK